MNVLEEWLAQASALTGLDPTTGSTHRDLVLDLARDVAHGVARPAAPLTTFLLGLAAGRAGGDVADIESFAAQLSALAAQWTAEHGAPEARP
ncbi:hypothetical protein acdb102_00710 [Acidothermaceae bacterium B102]|nr:hypothetical protein acdb102_00710 [Acidothermaceae bacterium B102]